MGAGSGALLNGEGGARGDGEGGGDLWAAGARHAGGNSPPPFWRILSLSGSSIFVPCFCANAGRECSLKPERCGLQVGNWADLLLFDPATINSTPTERVADLPAGASRLTRRSVGVFGTCTTLRKAFSCLDGKPQPAVRTVLSARRPLGLVGLTRRRRVRAGVNGLRVIENDVLVDGVGEAARPGAVMRQFNEPL